MSWDQFYSNVKSFAKKTVDQIDYSADLASLNVKLAVAEKKVNEAFCELGKVAYAHFAGEENSADQVAEAMVRVNDAKRTVAELKLRIQKMKQARAETQKEKEKEQPSEQPFEQAEAAEPPKTETEDTAQAE